MSDQEDQELQALQRQLDDAFQTTRPRAGFEDDLWSRMQTRRPAWARLRDIFARLLATVRRVPGAPAAAVAVVLVLAIGIGIISFRGPGGGGGSTATSRDAGTAPLAGSAATKTRGAFGPLPLPSLTGPGSNPADLGSPDQASAPLAVAPRDNLYFGPAKLTWGGRINVTYTQAPVFRYQEPTADFANQFAAAHQWSLQAGPPPAGYLGTYTAPGLTISIRGSNRTPPSEPFYVVIISPSAPAPAGDNPVDVANKYLQANNLGPPWPPTAIDNYGGQQHVKFIHVFDRPDGTKAYLVDGSGEYYGAEVAVSGGRPVRVTGPLPVSLEASDYPIISTDAAISAALAMGAAGSTSIVPMPAVQLTSAELVYALVWAGDHSFYEPCFMFSGTFDYNGTKHIKRVLVPAVAA
jgi:hypothetical protein